MAVKNNPLPKPAKKQGGIGSKASSKKKGRHRDSDDDEDDEDLATEDLSDAGLSELVSGALRCCYTWGGSTPRVRACVCARVCARTYVCMRRYSCS